MIYISIRFEKKNSGAVSCLARFVRQSFGGFLFLRFCFFWHVGLPGFWGFGVLGVWPVYFCF